MWGCGRVLLGQHAHCFEQFDHPWPGWGNMEKWKQDSKYQMPHFTHTTVRQTNRKIVKTPTAAKNSMSFGEKVCKAPSVFIPNLTYSPNKFPSSVKTLFFSSLSPIRTTTTVLGVPRASLFLFMFFPRNAYQGTSVILGFYPKTTISVFQVAKTSRVWNY